jgi:hypothetical protein
LRQVPIRAGRRFLGRKVTGAGRTADANADCSDFANPAVPDHLHGGPETVAELTPLLAARLKDDAGTPYFLHDLPAFRHIMSQRLFAVNMLFSPCRQDAGHGMPVIRCRNDDSV